MPKSNISLQAEPAFYSPTAVQPPPNAIRQFLFTTSAQRGFNEQLALINQPDEDEKNALVKIINSMLTKKRMKDLLDGKVKLGSL